MADRRKPQKSPTVKAKEALARELVAALAELTGELVASFEERCRKVLGLTQ